MRSIPSNNKIGFSRVIAEIILQGSSSAIAPANSTPVVRLLQSQRLTKHGVFLISFLSAASKATKCVHFQCIFHRFQSWSLFPVVIAKVVMANASGDD